MDIYLNTVQDFNNFHGFETLHPLISVVRNTEPKVIEECIVHYGLYALFLKENKSCTISYGRTKYDFDEMTVTSFAPGQTVNIAPVPGVNIPKWTAIVFHPDLLSRTQLGRTISRYEFFSYSSNEALHLSLEEIEVFRSVLNMITNELKHSIDKHTRELIVSNIELLLNFCLRFYDRQFITREEINHSVVQKFDALLIEYLTNRAMYDGIPSVAHFADKCCLSKGYFGELVKVETGLTAKEFISEKMLTFAKQLLNDDKLTISQVSNRLGFEYPQHFVRFFKSRMGLTPSKYRAML